MSAPVDTVTSGAAEVASDSEAAKDEIIGEIQSGQRDASDAGEIIATQEQLNDQQASVATATDIAKADQDEAKMVRNKVQQA